MNFILLLSVLWASFKKLQVAVTCIFWLDRYFQRSPFCGFPKRTDHRWMKRPCVSATSCRPEEMWLRWLDLIGPQTQIPHGSLPFFDWHEALVRRQGDGVCEQAPVASVYIRWCPFLSVFSRKELILYVMPAIRLALQVPLLGWQVKDCGANYCIWKWIRIHKAHLVHKCPYNSMKHLVTQELVEDEMDQRLHRLDGDVSGAVKDDVGFVTLGVWSLNEGFRWNAWNARKMFWDYSCTILYNDSRISTCPWESRLKECRPSFVQGMTETWLRFPWNSVPVWLV